MSAYAVRRDRWAECLQKHPAKDKWAWHFGKVQFRCPTCDEVMHLGEHGIDDEGVVTPSVRCPHCDQFHENLILEMYGDDPT